MQAVDSGLSGICFTEHMPLPNNADAHLRLTTQDIAIYRQLIIGLKPIFRDQLEVYCGLEMDFIPGIEAFSQGLLATHQWDYIIGSVHRVGDLGYGIAPDVSDLESYWQDYYDLVKAAATSGLYDSIGHLDLPRRWVETPPNHLAIVLPVLDVIAAQGLALDLNTSGYRNNLGGPHPSLELLSAAYTRNIPIVLGSDAHAPTQVATGFTETIGLARQAGYSQAVIFKNRQLETQPFTDTVWG